MPGDVNIAAIAALLADTTRATILLTLSDGRALTAGELARRACVAPSTISVHLAKLVEANILAVEQQGRHRYFCLADPTVVHVLEALALLAPTQPVRSLREADVANAIRQARTCYNHLAGTLGVALTNALVSRHILVPTNDGYYVSDCGEDWLQQFGLDCTKLKKQGHLFAPQHIDWSERRHHLAGQLGAALTQQLFQLAWIKRTPSSRAVCVTEIGHAGFSREFDLHV